MEKYVNVEPLPPAVLFDDPSTDGTQRTNEFGAIEDDEDDDEEDEEDEEETEAEDDEEGQLALQPLGKTESLGSGEGSGGGSVAAAATSILGTVLASTKSPFELLEDDED
jgi:hypothetical protein